MLIFFSLFILYFHIVVINVYVFLLSVFSYSNFIIEKLQQKIIIQAVFYSQLCHYEVLYIRIKKMNTLKTEIYYTV